VVDQGSFQFILLVGMDERRVIAALDGRVVADWRRLEPAVDPREEPMRDDFD
jgi:hypothetical protein